MDNWKVCECCEAALGWDDDDEGWIVTLDDCDICPECAVGVPVHVCEFTPDGYCKEARCDAEPPSVPPAGEPRKD